MTVFSCEHSAVNKLQLPFEKGKFGWISNIRTGQRQRFIQALCLSSVFAFKTELLLPAGGSSGCSKFSCGSRRKATASIHCFVVQHVQIACLCHVLGFISPHILCFLSLKAFFKVKLKVEFFLFLIEVV